MSTKTRLSLMMFLQFFVWGSWFATLGKCLADNGLGDFGGGAYGSAPIAAMIAPLFLGLIADRFFPSQAVMGVLMLLGAAMLYVAAKFAFAGNGSMMVWCLIGHMLCYMPTLGLSNSIVFTHVLDPNEFPAVRVWGTLGWIVAGLTVGFLGWSGSFSILWLGSVSSVVCGLYCFTLPATPPPAADRPLNLRAILMFDAFALMLKPAFFVFILCSTLLCIPLAYYYGLASNLLGQVGFEAPAATLTLGQMSEIGFMLLIPFFFRRLGVKWMLAIGMVAWVMRYLLFAYGASQQASWMILLAVVMHGICYDFFFVTGFMYVDDKASKDIRGQAQSTLVFFTQGVGMYFGYMIAFAKSGSVVTQYGDLKEAITAAQSDEPLTFVQSLGRMFSMSLPEGVDSTLLSETMSQWKGFWITPAFMSAAILILFCLAFHDRMSDSEAALSSPTDESPPTVSDGASS